MVARLLRGGTDGQDTPYMQYSPLDDDEETSDHSKHKRVKLKEVTEVEETADSDHEQLVGGHEGFKASVNSAGARARSNSSGMGLKNRLKQMKAGFSNEKRGVADAFIDSTKNKPKYMKDEDSNDLLV